MSWNRRDRSKPEWIEYDPEVAAAGGYTAKELELIADQLLRDNAAEVADCSCPPEAERPVGKDGKPAACRCKRRGIDGEHPILFEEHLHARRKREIFTEGGTPDPSLVQGIYNRTHPQGRKVNTDEQRRKNGASYYR